VPVVTQRRRFIVDVEYIAAGGAGVPASASAQGAGVLGGSDESSAVASNRGVASAPVGPLGESLSAVDLEVVLEYETGATVDLATAAAAAPAAPPLVDLAARPVLVNVRSAGGSAGEA